MASQLQHDPNPGFGRVPPLDFVKALAAVGGISVQSLFFALGRLLPGRGKGTFKAFILRTIINWLPDSVLRRPASLDSLFASKRYGGAKAAAFVERVDRPGLSGFWLKPELAQVGRGGEAVDADKPAAPVSEADVVVLFAHGGGYVVARPEMFAPLWLRVMEQALAQKGQRMAVFLLDYRLAPEHPFPHQLQDMTAAWTYAVGELGVSPAKLALSGDSAGGSLCLSFLAHRAKPLAGAVAAVPPEADAKPGRGVFLLSPWVSLTSENGYAARADTDVLHRTRLRSWAQAALQGADPAAVQQYLEFAGARDDWPALLPAYTWASAGGDEMFHDNIAAFAAAAQAAGCRVDLAVEPGMAHDWQVAEALGGAKAMYALAPGAETAPVKGADALATAIVSV